LIKLSVVEKVSVKADLTVLYLLFTISTFSLSYTTFQDCSQNKLCVNPFSAK